MYSYNEVHFWNPPTNRREIEPNTLLQIFKGKGVLFHHTLKGVDSIIVAEILV